MKEISKESERKKTLSFPVRIRNETYDLETSASTPKLTYQHCENVHRPKYNHLEQIDAE